MILKRKKQQNKNVKIAEVKEYSSCLELAASHLKKYRSVM
jgi:hypothetical protein